MERGRKTTKDSARSRWHRALICDQSVSGLAAFPIDTVPIYGAFHVPRSLPQRCGHFGRGVQGLFPPLPRSHPLLHRHQDVLWGLYWGQRQWNIHATIACLNQGFQTTVTTLHFAGSRHSAVKLVVCKRVLCRVVLTRREILSASCRGSRNAWVSSVGAADNASGEQIEPTVDSAIYF